MSVSMFGPAFDEGGKIVNREVPEADVVAFEAAGYQKGKAPGAPDVKLGSGTSTPEAKVEAKAEAKAKADEAKK